MHIQMKRYQIIEATNAIANEVGYDVQADIKAKEYAKMISSDPLKQHMRMKGRCYPDQRIKTSKRQNIQV
jgi:hypothetical protein